jgi:hypothetical protein
VEGRAHPEREQRPRRTGGTPCSLNGL